MATQGAQDWDIYTFALTGSDVEIKASRPIKGFLIQCRGESDVQIRRQTTDTKYWTLKAGSSVGPDVFLGVRLGTDITIGFAKLATGTDTLELIVVY